MVEWLKFALSLVYSTHDPICSFLNRFGFFGDLFFGITFLLRSLFVILRGIKLK